MLNISDRAYISKLDWHRDSQQLEIGDCQFFFVIDSMSMIFLLKCTCSITDIKHSLFIDIVNCDINIPLLRN